MDYFQGVVVDYLRANRATFVNTECCIQLNAADNPDRSGPHWFCDAVAVNMHDKRAYLCEITYSKSLGALTKRLTGWGENWPLLRLALLRDCGIPLDWATRPWIFIPKDLETTLRIQLGKIGPADRGADGMPVPKVTWMEDTVPWKYQSWNRKHEDD